MGHLNFGSAFLLFGQPSALLHGNLLVDPVSLEYLPVGLLCALACVGSRRLLPGHCAIFLILIRLVREMSKRKGYWFVFIVCSILIYELPYFLTLRKTGWTPLAAVVDYPADQMLYQILSTIQYNSPSEVVNPWYGNPVPAVDVPHLRFPITFLLFRLIHGIFPSWTVAMLVWASIWAGLTFAAAEFCLSSLFPNSDRRLTILGAFGLLVLQSPLTYIAEVRQLPSVAGFYQLWLPFLRFAYPQVIVPVVLAYWALQVRALKSGSKWVLAGMTLLQFAAFVAFPYIVLVIAVGTAITILIARRGKSGVTLSWTTVVLFAVVCGILDIVYLLLVGFGSSHGNVRFALQFRPEMILPALRPYVLLLVAGAGFALASRASLEAKTTIAGLALSNAIFAFSDVFFPATSMMLLHINYLITVTTWLPLIVALWPWFEKFDGRRLRIALTSAFILIGVWEGFASYRSNLSFNALQAAAVEELKGLALTPKDLVVAPAQFSDDISCLVPLVTRAKVLFTRDAENILSADSIRGEQAFRQALYLEMSGITHDRLLLFTEPGSPDSRINPIALFGELGYASSKLPADRAKVRTLVRERLGPMLTQVESDPASASSLFQGYDRVIVIDGSSQPLFKPSAFSPWLKIEQAYERNGTRVWICEPRASE